MTNIIKNIYSTLSSSSIFSRMVGMLVLTFALLFGESSNALAFTDFEIDLTKNPVGDLPAGVTQISYPQNGVSFNGSQHGWCWYAIEFAVDGPVKISLGGCRYINDGYEGFVTDASGNKIGDIRNKTANCYDADGSCGTFTYSGDAQTLKLYCGQYCPSIKVEALVISDEDIQPSAPYNDIYDAVVSNALELKYALAKAPGSSRYKIFVKNGSYDLGATTNTSVKSNTTIIGESRDGVIIQNAPTTEGIGSITATLTTGSNVVMQNLTLKCTVAYNSTTNAERGTALFDDGSGNVFRNIRLLGRQDTYYSSNSATSYFEDCEIHGTVDFICGGGSVWFEKCSLLLENRASAVIAAPNNSEDKNGFTFNLCTIDNAEGANMAGKYSLARGWQYSPKCAFYQTNYKVEKTSTLWGNDITSGLTNTFIESSDAPAVSKPSPSIGSTLAAPAEVTIDGNTITWSSVTGASAYAIYKGANLIDIVADCSYTIEESSSAKITTRRNVQGNDTYYVAAVSEAGIIGELAAVNEVEEPIIVPFKDFFIDLTANSVTLPPGVTQISYPQNGVSYNGSQHGWCWYGIQFDVDGPVDILLGGCKYVSSGEAYLTDEAGNKITTFDTKTVGCGGLAIYKYTGGAQTLKLYCGQYCPSIKVQSPDKTAFSASWDWTKKPIALNKTINNTVGWLSSDNNVSMYVDAISGSGKLAVNGDNVQFNNKTRLLVPVYGVLDNISIVGYPGLTSYSVHGIDYTGDVSNVMVNSEDVAQGYIVITATDNKYLKAITLNHQTYPITSKWDFTKSGYPSSSLEGKNGKLVANEGVALELDVDATSGKLADNGSWAQFNSGTKIKVPVGSVNDVITVNVYTAGKCKVGGVLTQQKTTKVNPSVTDVQNKYIVIEATDNDYLGYIQVVQNDPKKMPELNATWDWQNANPSTITSTNIQNTTGTLISDIEGLSLNVDASNSGKLQYNSSGYAQFNSGTIISVPVRCAGDIVTVVAYPGQYKYTVGGIPATQNLTVHTATSAEAASGKVDIVATGTAYLYSISLKQIEYEISTRSFVDFKLNFRTNPYTVVVPENHKIPEGVKVSSGTYDANSPQHGAKNATVTVPVDGPVKFHIGGCQYVNKQASVSVLKEGETTPTVISLASQDAGCDTNTGYEKNVEYFYNFEESATLTFTLADYCPYFIAEACDYVPPVYITYVNTDGTPIGEPQVIDGGSAIKTFKYGETDITISDPNYAFRGWFYSKDGDKKVKLDDTFNADKNLYAVVTPIEVATKGSIFTYDLTKSNFYMEDHELIEATGGSFHDGQHGWSFGAGGTFSVKVAGNSKITLGLCQYSDDSQIMVRDENNRVISNPINSKVAADGSAVVVNYEGPATTITFTCGGTTYIHGVTVKNEGMLAIKFAETKDKATIINNNEGATVYYTLDGSEPTTSHNDGHFTQNALELPITEDCWIKAISVKGGVSSPVEALFCRLTFVGFAWDFSNGSQLLGASSVATGVVIDNKGETHLVDMGNPSSSIDISTTWHDKQHGYVGIDAKVPVEGPVIITIGNSQYSKGKIKVTDTRKLFDTEVSMVSDNNYSQDRKNNFTTITYTGGPTVLTIKSEGEVYIPFLSVKDANAITVKFVNNNPKTLQGTVPAEVEVNEYRQAYIPENTTLYRDGWAVTGWTDGTKTYPLKSWQVFSEKTILYPVMTKSETSLADTDEDLTVVWPFDLLDTRSEVPEICINNTSSDPTEMTYTKCVTVNGSMIDVPLRLSGAKVDNTDTRVNSLSAAGAAADDEHPVAKGGQINDGGRLTIPAVYGMTIVLHASDKVEDEGHGHSKTRFDGAGAANIKFVDGTIEGSGISSNEGKTLTYTYLGDATTLNIDVLKAGSQVTWGFFEDLTVTYPVLPHVVANNVITNANPSAYPNENPENAGVVTTSQTTHANTGSRYHVDDNITITATAKYGYFISSIKDGDTPLSLTKNEPSASSEQPTKVTASYTIKASNELTIEYTRFDMKKVIVRSADPTLGTVDLSPIYENFYNKLEDGVESYFLPGTANVTATSEAAEEYILEKWTSGSAEGSLLGENNSYSVTIGGSDQTIFANFKRGEIGSVIFTFDGTKKTDGVYNQQNRDFVSATVMTGSIKPDNVTSRRSFIIPRYYPIYMEGYSLIYWEDADGNKYDLGKSYSFRTEGEEKTLHPVFEKVYSLFEHRTNAPVYYYDFGTGERAQKVDLPKNTQTFWTSHTRVLSIDATIEYDQQRDAAMYINTGTTGAILNGDLPEWAFFGEGTTLEVPSCPGATISFLTYAPVTSTTIGGIVPTLDEAASDPANHEYVYKLVTRNTDKRVPIVIGDDFSYYKWIKSETLEASLVDLHASVADDVHGKIVSVSAVNENYPARELMDGGYSFIQNNAAKITFQRMFGYEFDEIRDPDRDDLVVVKMGDDGKLRMLTERSATTLGAPITGIVDGRVTTWGDANTVFFVRKIEPTDEEKAAGERTKYDVQFNITTHRTIIIYFKEKPTYYITYNTGKLASGTAPAAEWVEVGDEFTIPKNNTLYYEGHTLKYWIDEQYESAADKDAHKYVINAKKTFSGSDDLRLFPVFEKNTFSILDVTEGTKARWPIAKNDGAPTIEYERSKGILVTQLRKGADFIDLKADLDASEVLDANGNWQLVDGSVLAGKFNNSAYDDRCQINENSTLSFPATPGCEITLAASNQISTTNIAGLTGYTPGSNVTVTYSGSATTQNVVFGNDGRFYSVFEVEYKPVTVDTKPTLTSVTYGSTTRPAADFSDKHLSVSVTPNTTTDAIPTVSAVVEHGFAEITQANINTLQAVVALKTGTPENPGVLVDTYTLDFTFNTTGVAVPGFVGFIVNGKNAFNNGTVTDSPVNGTIKVVFDHTMAATSFVNASDGKTYSAKQGKTLEFRYWSKTIGETFTFTIPNGILKDVYNLPYSGDLTVSLNITQSATDIVHRTFDYVVDSEHTLGNAIANANKHTSDRYYIFVPDGEYELVGNENIKASASGDASTFYSSDGQEHKEYAGKTFINGKTQISSPNVSLIGQSRDGVHIWNKPIIEGIGYTATLHLPSTATDFYAQDLTLENRFDYWKAMSNTNNSAARAVVLQGHADRTIMKNVSLFSYQDTYYSSNNGDADFCSYFENCQFAGVVDWLCGGGNVWWEKCDIILRDRSGNNIAAPRTSVSQNWGYIFNRCNVLVETEEPQQLRGKDWSLARPWGGVSNVSPACTFLYTSLHSLPRDAGWGIMNGGMVMRFHEYKTMDANGNYVSLGTRSLAACAPAAGSDDYILSDAEAQEYTIQNVLGSVDAFNPRDYTKQINATSGEGFTSASDPDDLEWNDDISLLDGNLQWNTLNEALCYFIFRKDSETGKWIYVANTAQTSETITSFNLEVYDEGEYMVRAANQRGGLGSPTQSIEYRKAERYSLALAVASKDGVTTNKGWSTICLPYNAKVPTVNKNGITPSVFKVYAAVGVNGTTIQLKKVDYITKDLGYIIYGDPGDYEFKATSHTALDTPGLTDDSFLSGNPSYVSISGNNINCYTLAFKPSISGIGMYKFSGDRLLPNRAWLDVSVFKQKRGDTDTAYARGIRFVILDDDATGIIDLSTPAAHHSSAIYDLSGHRVLTPIPGHVYIIDGIKTMWE